MWGMFVLCSDWHLFVLQIKQITLELLTIIRQTENDDLTSVMQKIVFTYTEQLMPIAVEICQHLVNIKLTLLELHDGNVCASVTAKC
jgi:hypothetical protein